MSPSFLTRSVSKCSLRSFSRAAGAISASANSRAVSRIRRCSSVNSKSITRSSRLGRAQSNRSTCAGAYSPVWRGDGGSPVSIPDTKPFLDEHAQLRDHVEHLAIVARELPGLSIDDRADVVERVAVFLVEILLPHAAVEERLLYPQAARVLGEDDASDAVARDRAEVRDLLHRLASADIGDSGRIQE